MDRDEGRNDTVPHDPLPGVNPVMAALRGRCPRCATGKLFRGPVALRQTCEHCGLNLAFYEQGDGPAVFGIFLVGFVAVGAAFWAEMVWHPPIWVHAVLWIPLSVILTLGSLRWFKAFLVGQQMLKEADEGRLSDRPEDGSPRGD